MTIINHDNVMLAFHVYSRQPCKDFISGDSMVGLIESRIFECIGYDSIKPVIDIVRPYGIDLNSVLNSDEQNDVCEDIDS